ncbi:hypothetical protein BOTBODRAFT_537772 [Botryobasidium botryosum FD-172 SS1]|uniref:NTF2 domain-containing protein n=1 Tax=Botryobasidium botryosum (strain FD-172 SS1) TaxID=930990 RepID=A0A067LZY2_BOTB1|nr:hypothetical protein BOTBODRAFT_537772 [Botryobasidium botryosum FD-172 SS1]
MTTTNPNQSGAPSATPTKVVPSEVGWQFVPQYYTFVNKQPHRLHCFYTKNSTFIHGTEGEDGKPCYGQQEIHNKILSIGFQDCKVFIHSVDAQSSANGGIIIQVIGEMSNNGDPWRKFAQTFFLAEQPNGYFVLNDIFRFLKEETAGDEESVEEGAEEPAQQDTSHPPNASTYAETLVTPEAQPAPPAAPVEPAPAAEPTPEPPAVTLAPEPAPPAAALSNGVHAEPEEPPAVDSAAEPEVEQVSTPAPAPVALSSRPATPPPAEAPEAPEPAPVPAPAPISVSSPAPPAPVQVPAPTPAPAPRPPQPKTWANLAASNSNKWGAQVAQDAKGVSAAPPAPPSPAPIPPKSGSPAPRDGQHPAAAAAFAITTPQCFVKNVLESVATNALRDTLTNRFGPVKELDVVRSKACAFLEFNTVEAARRAILASLPLAQGGEGGIKVGEEGVRITVELRKERGDRPPSRPRNVPPPNGEMRGGYRGGRGAGGGGRGRGIPK